MKLLALGAAIVALSAPLLAQAQPAADDQRTSVAVHYGDIDVNRPDGAAALLNRIGQASLEACGASVFSFREVKEAVRDSECYRNSMQQAVLNVGAPAVTRLYNHRTAQVMVGTQ
jgi:UrcA family protein